MVMRRIKMSNPQTIKMKKTVEKENKFVYTKAQSRVIGQEQLCPKIMKKGK